MIRLMRALEVIKAGHQVSNPAAWKNVQVWTNLVAAVFMFVQAFGVGVEFSNVHYEAIGIIVVMVLNILVYLFNIYSTYASSKKVGL
jgi:hypothetical protein